VIQPVAYATDGIAFLIIRAFKSPHLVKVVQGKDSYNITKEINS
jgi:hypothetical protein